MRFRLIDAERVRLPVARMCAILNVSVSGYYAWKRRGLSRRRREDRVYLSRIRTHFAASRETYGSPRIHAELQASGQRISRHRTARLMRENGLCAKRKRRFRRTTDSHHIFPVAPNLLEQDFTCQRPNQRWGADISYVWTRQGWLYLALVLDFYSRRIVGWAVSDRLKQELVNTALRRAVAVRRPPPGLIHHSDRGSQYCSNDYRGLLQTYGMQASMSSKGNCYDNAMVETVFKTIKAELVWRTSFQSRRQAETEIGHYIDGFYNPRRRHSAIGYKSPLEFEAGIN